jgi:hypothetical protein
MFLIGAIVAVTVTVTITITVTVTVTVTAQRPATRTYRFVFTTRNSQNSSLLTLRSVVLVLLNLCVFLAQKSNTSTQE